MRKARVTRPHSPPVSSLSWRIKTWGGYLRDERRNFIKNKIFSLYYINKMQYSSYKDEKILLMGCICTQKKLSLITFVLCLGLRKFLFGFLI